MPNDRAVSAHSRRAPGRPCAEFDPGRGSITLEPTVAQTRKQTALLVHEIAESMTCAMNEHSDRREAKLRAGKKAAKMQKELQAEQKAAEMHLQEDLIRIFEECKQAGAVVDVSAADMAPDLRQQASERLPSETKEEREEKAEAKRAKAKRASESIKVAGGRQTMKEAGATLAHEGVSDFQEHLSRIPLRRHTVYIIPRGNPGLSSTTGVSSPPREREGRSQRIAAMQLLGQKDCAGAVNPGDRLQPEDPAGSRSPLSVGSPLAKVSLQDDCGGQVLDRRKEGWGVFGLLSGACHRASMFIPRMRWRVMAPLSRSGGEVH